jgi:hypothetical protein
MPSTMTRTATPRFCFDKAKADLVRPKNIGGEADAVLGLRDRVQHRRIGLVTIVQDFDPVRSLDRPPTDPADAEL